MLLDQGYVGYPKDAVIPNGNMQTSSQDCMALCEKESFCDHFTWYKTSGACWLQNTTGLHLVPILGVISGPAFAGPDPRAQRNSDQAAHSSNTVVFVAASIAAAVILIVALVMAFLCFGKEKATKSKKSKELLLEEAQPLQGSADYAPQAAGPEYLLQMPAQMLQTSTLWNQLYAPQPRRVLQVVQEQYEVGPAVITSVVQDPVHYVAPTTMLPPMPSWSPTPSSA